MKWREWALVGCGGLLVVCSILPFTPYFWRVGQASQARQRWAQNGAGSYTVIVLNSCCPSTGRVKLTVENGLVTAAQPIDLPESAMPSSPAYFNFLTVEAMLSKAESTARSRWDGFWFSELNIEYDPTYGYITNYTSNTTGWLTTFIGRVRATPHYYIVYDLQFTKP